MSIGIYKIESPSGKIYIGQSINIEKRWSSYLRLYKGHMGIKLYNSLKKYGPKNHKFDIIEECNIEQLNNRELYWGQYYRSLDHGLNGVVGGGGLGEMSNDQKLKIGKSNTKPKPINFNNKLSKKVLKFDINGLLISIYSSYNDAVKKNGYKMHEALKGRAKTTKGFIWKYEEDWDGNIPKIKPHGNIK